MLRIFARANQSADWLGLDWGVSADFWVIKGETPPKPPVVDFVMLGEGGAPPGACASIYLPRRKQSAGQTYLKLRHVLIVPETYLNLRCVSTFFEKE